MSEQREDDLKSLEKENKAAHKKIKDNYDIESSKLTCRKCGFFTNSPIIAAAHLANCPSI